jgi:hypothetical protein
MSDEGWESSKNCYEIIRKSSLNSSEFFLRKFKLPIQLNSHENQGLIKIHRVNLMESGPQSIYKMNPIMLE